MARLVDAVKGNPTLQEEYYNELAKVAEKYPDPNSPEFLDAMQTVEAKLNPAQSTLQDYAQRASTVGKKALQTIDWVPGIGRAALLGSMELAHPSAQREAESPEYQKDKKELEEAITKEYGYSLAEMQKMPEYTKAIDTLREEHKVAPFVTKEEFATALKGPFAKDYAPSVSEGFGRAIKEEVPFVGSIPKSTVAGKILDIAVDPALLLPGGSITSAMRKTPTLTRKAKLAAGVANTALENKKELQAALSYAEGQMIKADLARKGKPNLSVENLKDIAKTAGKFALDPKGSVVESTRRKMARSIYEAADKAAMETPSLSIYEGTRSARPEGYKISDFILDEGIPVGNKEQRIAALEKAREDEIVKAQNILRAMDAYVQVLPNQWMKNGIDEAKKIAKTHPLKEVREAAKKLIDPANLKILSGVPTNGTPMKAQKAADRLHELQATLANRGVYTDSIAEQVDNAKNLVLGRMASDLRKKMISQMDSRVKGAGGEWSKRNERFRRFNMAFQNELGGFRKTSDNINDMTQASGSPAVIAAYGIGQKTMNAGIPAAYATTMAVNATKNKGFQSFLAAHPRIMNTAMNAGKEIAKPVVDIAEKAAYPYPVGKEALQLSGWDYITPELAEKIKEDLKEKK